MLSTERKIKIAEIINRNRGVKTSELSEMFGVSEMTILRDLSALEKQGILTRVYGGAVSTQDLEYETTNILRDKTYTGEEEGIANKALELITEGESIVMGGSAILVALAKKLHNFKKLTVITISLNILDEISNMEGIKAISPGGELDKTTMNFLGRNTEEFLKNLNADKAFISAAGVSLKAGLTEPDLMQSYAKKIMLENSLQKILLIDSGKFEQVSLNRICGLEKLDLVITDKKPEPAYLDFFEQKNIKVISS